MARIITNHRGTTEVRPEIGMGLEIGLGLGLG